MFYSLISYSKAEESKRCYLRSPLLKNFSSLDLAFKTTEMALKGLRNHEKRAIQSLMRSNNEIDHTLIIMTGLSQLMFEKCSHLKVFRKVLS